MALPFEDQLPFEELPFEQEDSRSLLDKAINPNDSRTHEQVKKDFHGYSKLRQAATLIPGTVEALGSMASTIPAMVAGGAAGVSAALQGNRGDVVKDVTHGVIDKFTYQPRSDAGKLVVHDAGEVFNKGVGYIGDLTSDPAPFAIGAQPGDIPTSSMGRDIGETAAEAAMAVGPLKAGLSRYQGARAQQSAAETLLQNRQRGMQEYDAWGQEWQPYDDHVMQELDKTMVKYGKDLQAPQFGQGGKVARIDDQVGKREKGPYASQLAYDEDMYKTGQDYQAVRDEAHEQALQPGVDQLGQYGPEYGGSTLDHAPELVRPHQVVQERYARISEGEATQIYRKPPFDRTLEERLQLQDYENSLKGPDIEGVSNDGAAPTLGARTYDEFKKFTTDPKVLDEIAPMDQKIQELDYKAKQINSKIEQILRDNPSDEYYHQNPEVNKQLAQLETELQYVRMDQNKIRRDIDAKFKEIVSRGDQGPPPELDKNGVPRGDVWNMKLFQMQRTVPDAFTGKKMPTSREMLEEVAKNSKAPAYRDVAKMLLQNKDFNPRFDLTNDIWIEGKPYGGMYESGLHKVSMKISEAGNETIFVHEMVHAATVGAIEAVLRGRAPHLKAAVLRLDNLYTEFKQEWMKYNEGKEPLYGLKNIREFVAEALSNPVFQAELARRPLPTHLKTNILKSYWDKFVEGLSKILGFKHNQNYLSETIKAGAQIIAESDSSIRNFFNKDMDEAYGSPMRYELKDFKEDLKAKGIQVSDKVARAMFDKYEDRGSTPKASPDQDVIKTTSNIKGLSDIQKQYVDKRPFEQVVSDAEKAKDISYVSKHVIDKMIQGKFSALDHPVLSWASSQIHWIKNQSLQMANQRLHGKSRTNPEPGTYNYVWKQLSAKERGELNQVGWALNGQDYVASTKQIQQKAAEILGKELSQKQMQSYKDRVNINHQVLDDINKKLVANKKDPIPALPNYWSPNMFDGPFLTRFVDPKTGETKKIVSSYTKPNLDKMGKQFPDYKLNTEEIGLKGDLDFNQIEWMLRQLNKELKDPASKAIAEALRRQGFRRHGLKRDMVEGGLGSGPSRGDLRKYEEVSERYIRGAYEYIANRDLDELFNKVLDEKKLDGSPNAKNLALESIDSARGGANPTMEAFSRLVSDVVRGTVKIGTFGKLELPQRFVKDVFRQSNKVMTTLLLGFGNLTNLAAQGMQAWAYAPPKLLALAAQRGVSPALALKAMYKATEELTKWDDSKDIQKLKEMGALDATFRHDWSTYAADADPRYGHKLRDHLSGISTLSYVEANAVRRPAALMFLHMLREIDYDLIAKDKNEIYYVAKEMTDQYMVSTKWYEKPHMFSRSGLAGTVTSPLQSFATTWIGMLREYGQMSKDGLLEMNVAKQLPLASFLAVNVLTAGVLGLVGIKEWDMIANFVNKYFGYNMPTGTEYMLWTFKNPVVRFGALSNAIGMNVGATFNAPTLVGSFAPGAQLIGNVFNAGKQGARQLLAGTGLTDAPTSQEKRDAIKGVTPRFSWTDMAGTGIGWGATEKRFTPEGRPYQDTGGNAGPVTRDDFDWMARKLGTYSVKEAKEKTENYIMKREGGERSTRLSKAMNRVIDDMLTNPESFGPSFDRALKEIEKDKFSGDDIKNGLKREILSKILESDQRQLGHNSSRSAYLHQLLKELQ